MVVSHRLGRYLLLLGERAVGNNFFRFLWEDGGKYDVFLALEEWGCFLFAAVYL